MRKAASREAGGGRRRRAVSPADLAAMEVALQEARRAAASDEVPVGGVIVRDGSVVARAHNETVARNDPTAHAELLVVQRALQALGTDRLDDCTLYVTLEPCAQCAGAIVLAKVGRLVFGAYDDKSGMCGSVGDIVRDSRLNHRVAVIGGVEAAASGQLLREFFGTRRPPGGTKEGTA